MIVHLCDNVGNIVTDHKDIKLEVSSPSFKRTVKTEFHNGIAKVPEIKIRHHSVNNESTVTFTASGRKLKIKETRDFTVLPCKEPGLLSFLFLFLFLFPHFLSLLMKQEN